MEDTGVERGESLAGPGIPRRSTNRKHPLRLDRMEGAGYIAGKITGWAYEDQADTAISSGDTGYQQPIPTLNQWGIIFLMALILMEGARRIKRNRESESSGGKTGPPIAVPAEPLRPSREMLSNPSTKPPINPSIIPTTISPNGPKPFLQNIYNFVKQP